MKKKTIVINKFIELLMKDRKAIFDLPSDNIDKSRLIQVNSFFIAIAKQLRKCKVLTKKMKNLICGYYVDNEDSHDIIIKTRTKKQIYIGIDESSNLFITFIRFNNTTKRHEQTIKKLTISDFRRFF